ncbi:MAG: Rrf2 family transcriptional regulator [Chlorobi bacterium]|nr:Rrf2 family transcriptional regulator [Chlorobiota bacterium]
MLRLTKKVEYALFALQYMGMRPDTIVSSKEIADCCGLSAELVAKVLSALSRSGILRAAHGVHGGFCLARSPRQITLAQVVEAVEGHSIHLVQCEDEHGTPCYVEQHCTIRSPLLAVQEQIARIFEAMTIADLLDQHIVELELPNGQ